MPLLQITTNVPLSGDAKKNLTVAGSSTVSEIVGKSEQWVMVTVRENVEMRFGGSEDPCCYLELKSIGLPENSTRNFSAKLANLVEEHLEVPSGRVYIEFTNAPRHLWGYNGSTF